MEPEVLLGYVARGLVDNPDDIRIKIVKGESKVMILELYANPEDLSLLEGDDGETLKHIQTVLSAGMGRRKGIVELMSLEDMVEEDEASADSAEEEASESPDDEAAESADDSAEDEEDADEG